MMQDIRFSEADRLEILRRFGLLGGGEITPQGQDYYASLNYAQPTPMGLLDIGVDASRQKFKDFKRTGIDALRLGLNKGGEGFGAGVQTDYQGRNPFFELTYGKSF